MKAYDFEFDGKQLSEFGMILCRFDSGGLDTIDGVEMTFNTISSLGGSKHYLTSTTYEDCLAAAVQICKCSCSADIQEITSVEYREISRWLNRKGFYKLKFLDEEHIDIYYEASVSSINRIEIDGKLYGLELNIITNRPFALKEPEIIKIQTKKLYTWEEFYKTYDGKKGESTGKFVTSHDREFYPDDGVKIYFDDDFGNQIESKHYYMYIKEENVASIFDKSHEEGYIYPYTEIIVGNIDNLPDEEKVLKIHNSLENRDTEIKNVSTGEVIIMDYPIIQSSDSSHNIQNDFNWKFFRIANTFENRRNDFVTSLPCIIKVEYSPIIKVGL